MRITFMIPQPSLAGGVRVVADYASWLSEKGHEVTLIWPGFEAPPLRQQLKLLFSGRDPNPHLAEKRQMNAAYFQTGMDKCRLVTCSRPFILPYDLPDADVLVATWWYVVEWLKLMPPSKGKKVHFIQGDDSITPGQEQDRLLSAWRQPMHRIAVAPWLTERVRGIVGDVPVKIVLNGVDPNQFHAPLRGKQPVPTVGYTYHPMRLKGCDVIARAIDIARRDLPDLQVISFGAEEPTDEIPLAMGAGFEKSPPQDRIRTIYASCDAWLWGSRMEGFGLPLLEAMACRTPIVASHAGAAPELVSRGGGRLVPVEDPEAMAQALVEICRMPASEWLAFSTRAYTFASNQTVGQAAAEFEAALQEILALRD